MSVYVGIKCIADVRFLMVGDFDFSWQVESRTSIFCVELLDTDTRVHSVNRYNRVFRRREAGRLENVHVEVLVGRKWLGRLEPFDESKYMWNITLLDLDNMAEKVLDGQTQLWKVFVCSS